MNDLAELEKRVREGSPSALAVLVNHWRPRLQSYISPRIAVDLASRIDADDVLQEAVVYALGAVRRLDMSQRDLYGWMCDVCNHRLIDLVRRHRAACRSVATEEASRIFIDDLIQSITSPSLAAIRSERALRLEQAIFKLSEEQRELLMLHFGEGKDPVEIGQQLGREAKDVRSALRKMLKQLQNEMGADAGF